MHDEPGEGSLLACRHLSLDAIMAHMHGKVGKTGEGLSEGQFILRSELSDKYCSLGKNKTVWQRGKRGPKQ